MSASQSTGLLPNTQHTFVGAAERIGRFITRRRVAISVVLFGALALYDAWSGYRPRDPFDYRDPFGASGTLLVLCGLGLRSWAAGILHKDTELTTCGPYRSIRNPLYAGSFLMMLGFCLLVAKPVVFVIVAGAMAILYSITVRREERYLSRTFPAQWAAYSRATPRFIPRLRRLDLTTNWRAGQWLHHREYQALAASMGALLLIAACR